MFTPKIRWTVTIFFVILILGLGMNEWTIFLALIPLSLLLIAYFYTKPDEELPISKQRVEKLGIRVSQRVGKILDVLDKEGKNAKATKPKRKSKNRD